MIILNHPVGPKSNDKCSYRSRGRFETLRGEGDVTREAQVRMTGHEATSQGMPDHRSSKGQTLPRSPANT